MRTKRKPVGPTLWGVMAEFAGPAALLRACEAVRDAGFRRWDAYAPFPVHDLEVAMGLKPSRVSFIVGGGALLGVTAALAMQYYMTWWDYPLVVQGKPFDAWEPFTPVTFELGILFASFGAILGMLALNGLPRHYHALFTKERFLRVSDDRFIVAIEARDPRFNEGEVRRLLETAGATRVETVEEQA